MTSVVLSKSPGFLLEPERIVGSFTDGNSMFAISYGGAPPPSISKYIAYDTLSPPNPFLATTEDGRGRVVYDGGFPKFISNRLNIGAVSFAQLDPASKFLYNAINWVSNTEKIAAGRKKMLILGDNTTDNWYSIKKDANDGFLSALQMIARVTGYEMVIKDINDYGRTLNPTLVELEQYNLVICFGINQDNIPYFTPQAVNDLVTYRENGNGLIFITDHGNNLPSISQAATGSTGFFTSVNQVITRFGAYFTGNFDRSPVNVGFLRRTYGDHPLYNNLSDAENISAGGSESRVVVPANSLRPTSETFAVDLVKDINTINLLILKPDDSVVTARYTYIVAGDEIIHIGGKDENGNPVENKPIVADEQGNLVDLDLNIEVGQLGTVFAEIYHNDVRVGDIMATSSGTESVFYAGENRKPFKNGDVITIKVLSPLAYDKTIVINRPEFRRSLRWDATCKSAREFLKVKTLRPMVAETLRRIAGNNKVLAIPKNPSILVRTTHNEYSEGSGLEGGTYEAEIYESHAAVTAAINAASKTYNVCFVNAQDGQIYAYSAGAIRLIEGLKAHHIWAAPCKLTNKGKTWHLAADGKITAA